MNEFIYALIVAVLGGLSVFLVNRKRTKRELINSVREQVLALFLYAEKQEWIGHDRMDWVVQQVYNVLPDKVRQTIGLLFGQDQVEDWVQDLYDEFKERLESEI